MAVRRYVVHEQSERGVRFFAVELERCFEFRAGWYRQRLARALVLAYYAVVRAVLRRRPLLRRSLTRCRHCRMFFITDPRNAGRHDLGCPFGCQQAHRKRESKQRAAAYYADEPGKMKKRIQNGKRAASKAADPPAATGSGEGPSEEMVKHVQRVVSAIEGRRVSREEVLVLILRQRSMGERAASGYDAVRPDERPP